MDTHLSKHDSFIRAIMGNQQIALDYFRACLPQHVLDMLNFSTLRQLPDTYVSKDLQKSISDIVYVCQKAGGEGEVKISLLVEHKSYVDKYTPVQIGSYIFSGLLKQIADGEKPSLIIPILLYHGKARWDYKTLVDLFEDLEPALQEFVPDYQYIFHNLGQIPDDKIQALHNKFLAASLLAMKYSAWKDRLGAFIPTIFTLADDIDKNLQSSLIVYIFVNSGLSEDEISELTVSLSTKSKDTIMNTLEIFEEKGRRKGIEEGKEEGKREGREEKTRVTVKNMIQQSSLTNEQIASIMEVDLDYVAEIRRSFNSWEERNIPKM